MHTAADYYEKIRGIPPISSGDAELDNLLRGGFRKGPVHFIYGPKKYLAQILMQSAVCFFNRTHQFIGEKSQIVYIDGENLFNPYFISKLAVSNRMGPNFVLDRILVARTFTWNQMVETVEENLQNLQLSRVEMILVSGLTAMFDTESIEKKYSPHDDSVFPKLNQKIFQDLKLIFSGINRATAQGQPIIVLTGPLHPKSKHRPVGGRLLSHFAGIIVGIHDHQRYTDYSLDQHPFLKNTQIRYWKSIEARNESMQKNQKLYTPQQNSLDIYMENSKRCEN